MRWAFEITEEHSLDLGQDRTDVGQSVLEEEVESYGMDHVQDIDGDEKKDF